jgi:hypothetical protein
VKAAGKTFAYCLGLAAGALLHSVTPVHAQVVPGPPSEVPMPPAPPPDTVRLDTVQPPVGRSHPPTQPATGARYVWEGDEILASGAYTLTDLLHRVPEITTFRTGWIHAPQFAAVAGDVRRIRIFLDDIELDAIDPREFGFHQLGRIPIWSLQRVAIERLGSEVRVDLRSWTVQRTTPYTRTDVYTGTEETDLYRGYYGKRFHNGAILQFGGEQVGTENVRFGGGGDAASILARAGVGRRAWSFDVFGERRRLSRTPQAGQFGEQPPYTATHTIAYARAAFGEMARGPFLELLASSQGVRETSPHRAPADTLDTTLSRVQYVATAGYRAGPLALRLTDRLRRVDGSFRNSLAGRVEFATGMLQASARAEAGGGQRGMDGTIRLQPLGFFSVLAAGSRQRAHAPEDTTTSTSLRLEAGLGLTGIWLYGGSLSVDGPPAGVNPLDPVRALPEELELVGGRRTAGYVGLRGRGWRGFGADTYVLRWQDPGFYVPEYQARAELNYETQWLSRFPRGEFGFRLAVADEFRSGVDFLAQRAPASHVLWALMEIRISRATLTLQLRNPLGREYFLVPGFEMPRGLSTYGVRWYFWG